MNMFRTAAVIISVYLATGVIASLLAGCWLPLLIFAAAGWTAWHVAKGLSSKP